MIKRNFKFIVEKTDSGYSAYGKSLSVYTTGDNLSELISNANEALGLYFGEKEDNDFTEDIELEMDLHQFFNYYRVINAKFLAQRIGMNESLLSQYVSGKKKPSSRQTLKIMTGIKEIGKELNNLELFVKEKSHA
ncbi:MAG: hypothetical protein RBS55_03340 [Bacteroidales bacterium]|jgi:predicted RNase H-like HicB family nuclease|nr:hypothetical protein [Bacteroidales bacterium]